MKARCQFLRLALGPSTISNMLQDGTPALYQALQYALNRFADRLGQPALDITQTIDANTVARYQMVVNLVTSNALTSVNLALVAGNLQSMPASQASMVSSSDQYTLALNQAADALQLPQWTPPLLPIWAWYAIGAGALYWLYKNKHKD